MSIAKPVNPFLAYRKKLINLDTPKSLFLSNQTIASKFKRDTFDKATEKTKESRPNPENIQKTKKTNIDDSTKKKIKKNVCNNFKIKDTY